MAEQRIHALEQKARTKYMRMKNSNDNENVRLKLEWEKMDREALHRLEGFLKDSNEISGLQKNCLRNSGWFGDAIRPKSREVAKMQKRMTSHNTKWNYFAGGSIDMWEKHPQTILRQTKARPHTAQASTNRTAETETQSPASDSRTKIRPVTAVGAKTDHEMIQMSLARSKSAKATRFRSPRLESDLKRKTKSKRCSIRSALASTELYRGFDAPNEHVHTQISQEDSGLDDVFDMSYQPIALKSPNHQPKSSSDQSFQNNSKSRPKSVSFKRQESQVSQQRLNSLHSKSKSSKNSSFAFDSDEEEEVTKSPVIALSPRLEWRMPKFYVRPEDRHRSEDMFLMRRHALLQRQIANGVPQERVTKHSKLKINATFSSVARHDYLNTLVDDNMAKASEDKKTEYKHNMQEKVDTFLQSLDKFLKKENKKG